MPYLHPNERSKSRLYFAALYSGLLITACATTEAPAPIIVAAPEPVVEIPAEPTPPPPLYIPARASEIRMEEALVRAAGNHAVIMKIVLQIPFEDIQSPEHLNQTMDSLAQLYSPGIGPAILGYGALIGAQNTDFAEGVLETARYKGIDSVLYQLYASPDYAASFPGASLAAADIQNAWASDIAAIDNSGANIRQQSYSLQKQTSWKKLKTDSRPERLQVFEQARTIRYIPPAATRKTLADTGTLRAGDYDAPQKRTNFWREYGRGQQPTSQTFATQYNSRANHKALTLSALEILGATGNDSQTWIENYMTSPRLNQCVNTARLNAAQCVAAGHFKYEDAFCVAEHELKEISSCLTKSLL